MNQIRASEQKSQHEGHPAEKTQRPHGKRIKSRIKCLVTCHLGGQIQDTACYETDSGVCTRSDTAVL